MKWSFVSVGVLIFCIIGIMVVTFFNEVTVSNEQDYYTLKEAAEASMYDAIDVAYYRLTGKIKISQEKFVENLTRRFTETSTFGQGNYDLIFYDISESPPKISVRVVDSTNSYNLFNTFSVDIGQTKLNIVNEISGILEIYSEGEKKDDVVGIPTSFVSKSNEEVEVIGKEEKDDIIEKLDEKKNSDTGIYKSDEYFEKIIDIINDLIDKNEFVVLYDGIIYVPLNSDVKEEDITGNCEIQDNKLLDCDGKTFAPSDIPEIVIDDVIVPIENIFEEVYDTIKKETNVINLVHIKNEFKYSKDGGFYPKYHFDIIPIYKEYVIFDGKTYVSSNKKSISNNLDNCFVEGNSVNCGGEILNEIDPNKLCCVEVFKDEEPFGKKYRIPSLVTDSGHYNFFGCDFEKSKPMINNFYEDYEKFDNLIDIFADDTHNQLTRYSLYSCSKLYDANGDFNRWNTNFIDGDDVLYALYGAHYLNGWGNCIITVAYYDPICN
ncbi:MAG: hypothetical protein IJO57_02215 [Bacilli bacterium]|nr:hypothetical protein [Bacilli bacterium]